MKKLKKKRTNQVLRDVVDEAQWANDKVRKLKDLKGYKGKIIFFKMMSKIDLWEIEWRIQGLLRERQSVWDVKLKLS